MTPQPIQTIQPDWLFLPTFLHTLPCQFLGFGDLIGSHLLLPVISPNSFIILLWSAGACNIMGVAYHLRRRLLKNHIVQNFVWQSLI